MHLFLGTDAAAKADAKLKAAKLKAAKLEAAKLASHIPLSESTDHDKA